MWTNKFWEDASERAIRAFATFLIVTTGADVTNLFSVGWEQRIISALAAGVVSILISLVATKSGNPTDASFVKKT